MIIRKYAQLSLDNSSGEPDHQTHYRTAGSGSPLVLLHPSPLSSAFMTSTIDQLKDQVTVIAPDTPGYGNSDPLTVEPKDLSPYVDWLAAFIRSMGHSSVGLYGSATGAQITIQFALAYPDMTDYIVLDNAVHFSDEERNQIMQQYFLNLLPTADGQHLRNAWEMSTSLFTHFPWYDKREENRIEGAQVPAEMVQATAMAYLTAGADYDWAYRAAFMSEKAENMLQIERPTRVIRWAGSMLAEYANRLDKYDWPENIRMVHCDASSEARFKAIQESVAEFID
jgi:pimeloyl-ACP methyl ester carboxylesterase